MAQSAVKSVATTILSMYNEQFYLTKEQYYVLQKMQSYLKESKPYLGEFTMSFSSSEINVDNSGVIFNSVVNKLNEELQVSGLKLSWGSVSKIDLPKIVHVTFHLKK